MAGLGGDKYFNLYRSFLTSRNARGGGATLALSLLFHESPDTIDPNSKTARSHLSERQEMTGLQRLKLMYSYDAYGCMSPEMSMVMQSGLMGALTGTVIGGTLHSKENYVRFIERNQGTAFQNMFEAQKQLQTQVTVGFGRGAWKWGWRLSLFCSSFMLFTSSIAAYRGKSSVIEYTGGGIITGAIFRLKLGPRASVAGAILGGALGTLAGTLNMAILYLTGTSTDQLRKYHYELYEQKQQQRLEELHRARERDTPTLVKQHDSKVMPGTDPLSGIEDSADSDAKQ